MCCGCCGITVFCIFTRRPSFKEAFSAKHGEREEYWILNRYPKCVKYWQMSSKTFLRNEKYICNVIWLLRSIVIKNFRKLCNKQGWQEMLFNSVDTVPNNDKLSNSLESPRKYTFVHCNRLWLYFKASFPDWTSLQETSLSAYNTCVPPSGIEKQK